MSDMGEQKKPAIRFKGFTDVWEQRKLLECIQKIIDFRGRTPKKLGMDWSDSGYLALSALNVKDGYIDFTQEVHYGSQELYDKWMNGNELHQGQVIFTTEAPMGNVAQVPDNRQYILSQRTIAFEVQENLIIENFLATVLRSPYVFQTLTALSSGGTAKGVSQKSLATVDITIPKDLNEQNQLAMFFSEVDNLITLHQRKYDKLVNIKKAMLEKMFPKDGAKVPEIRFDGFTDDWEQRKLGEVVEFYNGDRSSRYPNDSDMVPEGIPFINAGDLVSGRVKLDTANKITEEKYNELSGAKIQHGDIIYCLRGTLGKNAFVDNFDVGTVASSLVDIRPKKIVGKYLFQVLNSNIEYRQRTFNDEGAAQPNLSAKNLSLFDIPMPIEEEQEKIALYFDNLNNLITLHQRKLEKLQNIKKSMLEKMFM